MTRRSLPASAAQCELGPSCRSDAEYLEAMASALFRVGFSRQVVARKWPELREAFAEFDLDRLAELTQEEVEGLLGDPRVIRNRAKIEAVVENARTMRDLSAQAGSFRRYVETSLAEAGERETLRDVGQRFRRLGPKTSLIFLRLAGHSMPESTAQPEQSA